MSRRFPDNIDLKIARIVGKHIIGVVRGESNMLEHLRGDDTLDDYYANAMGTHYTEYIARIARQLSFKHPDLNFLEIGKEHRYVLSVTTLVMTTATETRVRGWNWCSYQEYL